jgi:hypothetical protein
MLPAPSNQPMPQTEFPNGNVAPFWDELDIDQFAVVHTTSGGASPNRFFVVEWVDAELVNSDFVRLNFEAVLFEPKPREFLANGAGLPR